MTTENSGVRFVIIGFGKMGQRYADLLLKQNGADLVGIVDIKITSTAVVVPYYSSVEALLEDQLEFDVAIIATPNGLHVQHALQCIEAGKHVVIEKPVALNTKDVNIIYEAAERNHKQVFPVFQNRYANAINWLKQLLNTKALGEVFMVQVNCLWNRNEAYYSEGHWHGTKEMDGGILFTQFSHYIDALFWLFGSVQVKDAALFNFKPIHTTKIEDSGVVQLRFGLGSTIGNFTFSTATFDQNFESSILILAENGTLKIGGPYMDQIVYQHTRATIPENLVQHHTNHELFVQDLTSRLQSGKGSSITKNEVIQTISLIEDIYLKAKNDGDIKNTPIFAS